VSPPRLRLSSLAFQHQQLPGVVVSLASAPPPPICVAEAASGLAGRERVRSSCEGDTRTEVGRGEANDPREEKEITQPPARNSAAGEDRSRKMCMDGAAVPVKRVWLGIAARLGLRRKTGTYACYLHASKAGSGPIPP
jgi:hypothetical protein